MYDKERCSEDIDDEEDDEDDETLDLEKRKKNLYTKLKTYDKETFAKEGDEEFRKFVLYLLE